VPTLEKQSAALPSHYRNRNPFRDDGTIWSLEEISLLEEVGRKPNRFASTKRAFNALFVQSVEPRFEATTDVILN
jgi:hypothetical protein